MPPLLTRCTLIVGTVLVVTACSDPQAPSAPPLKAAGAVTAATAVTSPAGKCDTPRDYEAPSQRFDERAQDLAHATGCFIETDTSETGPVQVPAVKGVLTIRDAIAKSIEGTPLRISRQEPDLIAVELNKGREKAAQ